MLRLTANARREAEGPNGRFPEQTEGSAETHPAAKPGFRVRGAYLCPVRRRWPGGSAQMEQGSDHAAQSTEAPKFLSACLQKPRLTAPATVWGQPCCQ